MTKVGFKVQLIRQTTISAVTAMRGAGDACSFASKEGCWLRIHFCIISFLHHIILKRLRVRRRLCPDIFGGFYTGAGGCNTPPATQLHCTTVSHAWLLAGTFVTPQYCFQKRHIHNICLRRTASGSSLRVHVRGRCFSSTSASSKHWPGHALKKTKEATRPFES